MRAGAVPRQRAGRPSCRTMPETASQKPVKWGGRVGVAEGAARSERWRAAVEVLARGKKERWDGEAGCGVRRGAGRRVGSVSVALWRK